MSQKTAAQLRAEARDLYRCADEQEAREAREKDCGCELAREAVRTGMKIAAGAALGIPLL